jgi:hypothetical protein
MRVTDHRPLVTILAIAMLLPLVTCRRSANPRAPATPAVDASASDARPREDASAPAEAGAPAEDAAVSATSVEAEDPLMKLLPVGPESALVRTICFVDAACAGKVLDRSAFVQHEEGGQSCEESRPAACPALAGNTPILEEKSFSTVCALGGGFLGFLGAHWSEEGGVGGGAPRGAAKASLRRLVARGVPCSNQPPGSRPSYRIWCERYRADGTLKKRDYYARLLGNDGENEWFERLDEQGKKITSSGANCDAGHH